MSVFFSIDLVFIRKIRYRLGVEMISNTKVNKLSWLLFICFSFISCTPPIYFNAPAPMPMFKQQDELHGVAAIGSNGYNIHGAYSITDKLGVFGSSSYLKGKYSYQLYGEMGSGYFTTFGAGRFGFWGGLGVGNSHGEDEFFSDSKDDPDSVFDPLVAQASGTYLKVFISPNIGLGYYNFELGLSTKVSMINYYYDKIWEEKTNEVARAWLYEPSVIIRIGTEPIKFEVQLGMTIPINKKLSSQPDVDLFLPYESLNYSLGIVYHPTNQ